MSKNSAIFVLFLILLAGGLWWVKSYSVDNIAYYKAICPHGSIVITGKGYCLNPDGTPYFPKQGRDGMPAGAKKTSKSVKIQ